MTRSLQDALTPESACFVCGPKNPEGFRIKSFPAEDGAVVCDWTPEPKHAAYPGILNGGVAAALLDCHVNWAAVRHLMERDGLSDAPPTVTAELALKYRRPTPSDAPLRLWARAASSEKNSVQVEGKILASGKATVTCTGRIVTVPKGHPALVRRIPPA